VRHPILSRERDITFQRNAGRFFYSSMLQRNPNEPSV